MSGIVTAAVIGGGAMLGSAAMSKGGGMQQGYDIVNAEEYPWARGNQEQGSQYFQNMLRQVQAGEQPEYMKYIDPMQMRTKKLLQDQVYGTAGRPGTLRDVMGISAGFGLGPGKGMSSGMQHVADYMTKSSKIDNFFDQMRQQEMSKAAYAAPQGLMNAQRGPEQSIVNLMGGGGQMGGQQQPMDFSGFSANVGEGMASGQIPGAFWNATGGGNMLPGGYQSQGYGSSGYGGGGVYVPNQQSSQVGGTTPQGYTGSRIGFDQYGQGYSY